jgi:23S rRNA pseudouridine2605 synthase
MKKEFNSSKAGQKRPRTQGGYKAKPSTKEGGSSYNFRDNPKTFNKTDKPNTGFGTKPRFGAEKPHVSKFDPNDRYGNKSFADKKPRNFDGDKTFGERKPKSFDGEKPRFDGEKKHFDNRPDKSFEGERPRFNKDNRPDQKSFGDRPKYGDKPSYNAGTRFESKPFGDRPAKNFSDKPRFDASDRALKSFDNRPKNDFGDKPLKRYHADKPRFENKTEGPFEPRPDKFANDKSRFAKTPGRAVKPVFQTPRPAKTSKRFEGPYQKNLNQDTGGKDRVPKKDSYRSDGAHFDYESRLKETIEEKNGTIRLNRYIANSGICSRRDADELIEAGQITVNGEVITEMGHQVKPTDVIKYGNKLLSREKMVYLLLNKPKDYITTTEDPLERKTVMNLIEGACRERIYPVGRLDRNTTGLLLFTNDGELASKLTHPSNNVEKMYQVELDKPITEEDYQKILKGVTLEDGEIKADDFGIVTPDAMVVGIKIHSGRNHIVRRIFAHLGYEVLKLDRTVFAGLNKKDLPRSKYRFLTEKEVIKLKYLS